MRIRVDLCELVVENTVKQLPDILEIVPLAKPPKCTITVPGSKSITNRALILAALSDGKCTLRGALWADDTRIMVNALRGLGFAIEDSSDPTEECNRTIVVEGCGGKIPATKARLYVGNAGTAARFLTALAALGHGEYEIFGDARMHERPMAGLFDALREVGITIESDNNQLPAIVHGKGKNSQLQMPRKINVDVQRSSQFASAILLVSRHLFPHGINFSATGVPSTKFDYVWMSSQMVDSFYVYKPDADKLEICFDIEPDLSSASYFSAANFLCGGEISISNWPKVSLQIDSQFPKFLPLPEKISREKDLGDSVLTLAICALFGGRPFGATEDVAMTITDAARLREQECDRIAAMVTELKKVGARAEETKDGFKVWPAEGDLHGAEIETYNDHRIAMCFSVLGLKVPGIRIKNPSCVSKTFPNFYDKLKQLGAEIRDAKTGRSL